jgi:hypothetical protein
MEDDFCCFRTFKVLFLLGQAGKKVKAKANAMRTELEKMGTVEEEITLKLEHRPRSGAK